MMIKILAAAILITSLMGCALAIDFENGVEMRFGEATAERLFEIGIGEPWIGGNPPSYDDYYSFKGNNPKKHIELPKKHEVKSEVPSTVYFGYKMQAIPYSQYQTYSAYTEASSLWIAGTTSWTQYAQVPQGSVLTLLANSPAGGSGYLYEITPDGELSKNSFYFFPGGSRINFYSDTIGRHVLLFVIDSQASNAIVIDVVGNYPSSVTAYSPAQIYPPSTTPAVGDTPVTISSQAMRGYQVFVDGNYIGTEGTGSDIPDGKFSFAVVGDQNHNIRVYDGQFNYPKTMYFEKGIRKIIYVEPGIAVYN
jgi:hypothetical protein